MSRVVLQAEVVDPLGAVTNGEYRTLRLDSSGRLQVTAGGGGVGIVTGNHTPTDAYANPTDAINSYSLLGGWNGATWDRIRTLGLANLPVYVPPASGIPPVFAQLMINQQGGNNMFPVQGQTVGDGIAFIYGTQIPPYFQSLNAAFNGATYDQVRCGASGDAVANPAIGALTCRSFEQLWNGATWDRAPSAPIGGVNLLGIGAQAVAEVAGWDVDLAQVRPVAIQSQNHAGNRLNPIRALPCIPTGTDVATYSPVTYTNHLAAAAYVMTVQAAAGRLLSAKATVRAVAGVLTYLQIHNTAAAPGAGVVPKMTFECNLAALASIHWDFDQDFWSQMGCVFTNGITFVLSSTALTYTAEATGPVLTLNANRSAI